MIYSLQFTDESLNDSPEAREWLEAVNAQLLDAQKRFLAELTAFGSASLELHAGAGRTFTLDPRATTTCATAQGEMIVVTKDEIRADERQKWLGRDQRID